MFGGIWPFLKDHDNLAVLGSIGAGIAALAGGAWAVFTFFAKKHEKEPSAPSVIINPEPAAVAAPINERLEQLAAQVARDKGVEVAPLRAVLVKLGEKGVPEEDIPKRLDSTADELIKLRAENDQLRRGPPALAAIAEEVQALIDKGEFDDARGALVRGREASRALRIDASLYEAAFLAQEARVDDLQLAYRAAAAKYAEAAALVAPFDSEQQWRFLIDQAAALYKQGDEFGDNAALIEAIDVYHRCLALAPRLERPLEWATIQMNLGNALARLGARESGTARLEEAVAVFREALQEYTRDRVPLDWAATQNNLGNALAALGERESGTARLEEAIAAYREALQEKTRARVPLNWAMTKNNLGLALFRLGERESGTERLEEAVAAYREALLENTRARVPLQWAMTQHNLARAYRALYDKTAEPRHLDNALAAIAAALDGYRKAEAPFYIENAKRLQNEIFAAIRK